MLVIIAALVSIIQANSDGKYFSRITSQHGRGFEPKGEFWQGTPEEVQQQREAHEQMRLNLNYSSYDFNVRVTKGMYSRGYEKVRLSVVTTDSRAPSGISWDYSAKFAWDKFNGKVVGREITYIRKSLTSLLVRTRILLLMEMTSA